jgi:hypothetical protein
MKITSIKMLADGVTLKWETPLGEEGKTVKHQLQNGTDPTPGFRNAVDELKDDIQAAMEYTKKYMDTVTVTGVNVGYDDDGAAHVTYTFKKKFLTGQVVGYSCPLRRQTVDHEQTGKTFLDDEQWARVNACLRAAERYITKGERAQTDHHDD